MNYVIIDKNSKYVAYFKFIPSFEEERKLLSPRYDGEYIEFNPAHPYACKEQLQKFIEYVNKSIDNTYFGNGQCGQVNLPREEMQARYVPEGKCPFISQSIKTIRDYFEKNHLSFDKFVDTYPKHNLLFDENVSNYDKIFYMSNKYDEIERDISNMRVTRK